MGRYLKTRKVWLKDSVRQYPRAEIEDSRTGYIILVMWEVIDQTVLLYPFKKEFSFILLSMGKQWRSFNQRL